MLVDRRVQEPPKRLNQVKLDLSLLDVPVTRVLLNISDFHHVFMEGPIIQLQYLDTKPHQP